MFVATLFLPQEGSLRSGFLLLAFVTFALWETFRPRRALAIPAPRRWANHALLWFLSTAAGGWIYRASAVLVAAAAVSSPYGLLNRQGFPFWARCAIAVLLIDLLRYGQHYLYHRVFFLWRIHQVHHGDPDYDWSTGLRFHPAEALLSHGIYLAAIAVIAPPPEAVLGLELAEIALNLFVHANISLPRPVETLLRHVLITPDMHRIHHSDVVAEQNTNFGVVFPWWDRLFGTYIPEPAAGQDKMAFGLRPAEPGRDHGLLAMLVMPFKRLS
jgi:sterol desaturase/sphingolipid hydroxylase (fatty acid hydroxylase superfamily)